MLLLVSVALLGFGLLLFSLGVAIWLLGLIIRTTIRLFQLGLLLVWAGIAFARWIRQRKTVTVLEGEVLPPQRVLPDRSRRVWLLFAGMLVLAVSAAHADNWRQRAQDAVTAARPPHQPCVLYADVRDNRLHVRAPVCFYLNGDVYLESYDADLTFNGRKAGIDHPAAPCAEIIEGVARVDPRTFLVRLYCEHATPQRSAVSVQLIGDTIEIRNTEAY
jgi:hypothetical protein